MVKKDYATYWVALKILLEKDGRFLFLNSSSSGLLDLPGGRADNDEYEVPLKKILAREIKEELGSKIKYSLGEVIFQCRRYHTGRKMYNFLIVFGAKYLSGPVKLSFEHSKYQWLDPKTYKFKEKEFYSKEEYQAFKEYFKGLEGSKNSSIVEKKIYPSYFNLVKAGKKKFELRLADFKIKTGDVLILREWDSKKKEYTGRELKKKANYVLKFNLNDFNQEKEIKKMGLYVIQF